MTDQYAHGLAADWRARSAMSTADKVGGAYVGWRPRNRRRSSWWIVLACLALVAVAVRAGL